MSLFSSIIFNRIKKQGYILLSLALILLFFYPVIFTDKTFFFRDIHVVFYPISLIFLFFPFIKAFNYFIVCHFFLGFCFFYLLIKELGLSRKAAIFTSLSYCFGGYTIATVNTLNNLSTIVWLPAILWSFTMAIKRKQP